MNGELQFAVIGRSHDEPTLSRMTTWVRAEWLRKQREQATGGPCYVVALDEWRANPLKALQRAEAARTSAE
jgi:hypothetical protein